MTTHTLVDLGIEQLQHDHHATFFSVPQNALQSGLGIDEALLRIHAITVSGKTNQVAIPRISHKVNMVEVTRDQFVMMFGIGKTGFRSHLGPPTH